MILAGANENTDGHRPVLLFVDDEPGIVTALHRQFRPHGYVIHTANSGAEGLAVLGREAVNLVVSDMRMPEMDGAQFLEQVRVRWPTVMRILLTGYADMESTIAAINRGEIWRYIAKPWNDEEIVLTVRDALEQQRLSAENARLLALTQRQNEELSALNAGLEQKVAERTTQLQATLASLEKAHGDLKRGFINSVRVFSGLTELRGGILGSHFVGHGRRVADMARLLATQMDMADASPQQAMLAGLLHDIGKIGLPDHLLSKPFDSLSGKERVLVKKHPVIAENLLMAVDQLQEAVLAIRHHHEQFDGSGYPDGLAGDTIPMAARILAVVNDYDALQLGTLTQRQLKPAEALQYIIGKRSHRYDPRVVDAFAIWLAGKEQPKWREIGLRPAELRPGMVLADDLSHRDGYLLLAAGYTLDATAIAHLRRIEDEADEPVIVHVRKET
ncbi:MAG: HD domain-containing phosphohydrolase [Sterolibacterium sp.]